jgi:hypothetical protein
MPDRSALRAIRDVGIGVGTVGLAVVLTFWGSLAAVQAVFVVMMISVLVWAATTSLEHLRGQSGWPRPLVFGALVALLAANASVFSFTGYVGFLLTTAILGVAVIVGLTRVLGRVGKQDPSDG